MTSFSLLRSITQGIARGALALMVLGALAGGPVAHDAYASAFNDPGAAAAAGGKPLGDLAPVETQAVGGSISVGSTSQVVVLFRNDSGRAIQTGAIQLYPSSTVSASVSLNQCELEELPAGATCAVGVSVKGLQSGAWRVEMIMRHTGRARLVRAVMAGQVDAGDGASSRFISDIESIPDKVDFGDVETAQPVINSVALRNTTSEKIDISAIYIEAAERAGYTLRADCESLEPGQACLVVVNWSPVLKGDATGVLVIEHSGPTRVASINLTGSYQPEDSEKAETFPQAVPGKGLLVASQTEIDFGASIQTTSAITVSLVNIGDSPVILKDLRLANSDNGLSVSKTGCGSETVLEPVEACPLTLTWSPVREGAILDDVQILHDGARGILVLPVRGTSTAIISQDSKAVRLGESIASTTILDPNGGSSSASGGSIIVRDDDVDPSTVLDGFIVTSHSTNRAIISGPGGSRIVFDGEEVVIGGFLWNVVVRPSGVEFQSGGQKVLLLFDSSLSSVNRTSSQSGRGAATPAAAAAPAATTN